MNPVTATPFTIVETAIVLAWYQHVERRLFEIVGAWVPSVPEPRAKVALAAAARRHAWHAELWEERRPLLHDLTPHVPAAAEVDRFLDAVAAPVDTPSRAGGLVEVVVPELTRVYEHHRARSSAASDGPVLRALLLVRRDLEDETRDGQLLLADLDVSERAAAHLRALRELLPAGGLQQLRG